jgi:hypothetical protein
MTPTLLDSSFVVELARVPFSCNLNLGDGPGWKT